MRNLLRQDFGGQSRTHGAIISNSSNSFYQKFIDQTIGTFLSAIATLRLRFCDMTSFKYGDWGLWERWRSEPMVLRTWDTGELQASNQPVNQPDNQTPNQPTDHSVNRPNFQTPHALANRSGIFHLRPVESGLRWTRPPP